MDDSTPISHIAAIETSSYRPLVPDDLPQHIEAPVLKPCQMLYDYGIRTLTASANAKDVGRNAHIWIDLGSLCTVNDEKIRKLADKYRDNITIHQDRGRGEVAITFPVTDTSTVKSIRDNFLQLIEEAKFLHQPAYWAEPIPYQEFIKDPATKRLIASLSEEENTPQYVAEYVGVHYEPANEAVYISEAVARYYKYTCEAKEPGTGTQVAPGRLGR